MRIIRDKLAAQGLETRGIFQRYNIINEEDPKQAALKARDIPLKPYDVKPVFAQYNDLVQKYQVSDGPTFIFVYSAKDVRKYTGREKIIKGLAELRQALGRP